MYYFSEDQLCDLCILLMRNEGFVLIGNEFMQTQKRLQRKTILLHKMRDTFEQTMCEREDG